jgi:hypothetical protein
MVGAGEESGRNAHDAHRPVSVMQHSNVKLRRIFAIPQR